MTHKNLSNEINAAMLASEKAGGIWLKDVGLENQVEVQTQNTVYDIRHDPDQPGQWLIKGHSRFCPNWTKASIAGSTFGGSMLKTGFIGVGMHLEFCLPGPTTYIGTVGEEGLAHAVITTSRITEVWIL